MMAVVTGALMPLFTGTASAVQFCNTTPIVFTPPPQPTQAVQALNPYPSQITVSGLTGTVTDVNVLLHDLTYEVPDDLDVMLVAPDGTRIMIMSDAGGANFTAFPVTDIDLTFDDEAAGPPSADGQLTTGTFRPIDDDDDPDEFDAVDTFVAPAPGTASTTTLSSLDGINPNGTWSLYVVDDNPGPPVTMDIGGGWCLDITTSATTTTAGPTTTSTSTTLPPTTTSTSTTTTMPPTTTSTSTTTTVPPTTTSTSTTTTVPPTTTSTSTTTTVPPTTTTSTTTTLPPTTTTSTSTTVPAGTTCDGRAATLVGTDGPDRLVGTPGPDVIVAGGGDDLVVGMGGDDVICGGAGNDSLQGGEGNDRLFGDAGTDQCVGGPGVDFAATCEATYEVP